MSLFSLDPGLVIWTWVAFAVLFFILSRFAFPKLLQTLNEREEMIAKSVDDAKVIDRQRAASASDRETILVKARTEADTIVRKARDEAEALRKSLAVKAEDEADAIITLAQRRTVEDRSAAMLELQEELAGLVCHASEQVIGKSFVGEAERKWAKELVEQL